HWPARFDSFRNAGQRRAASLNPPSRGAAWHLANGRLAGLRASFGGRFCGGAPRLRNLRVARGGGGQVSPRGIPGQGAPGAGWAGPPLQLQPGAALLSHVRLPCATILLMDAATSKSSLLRGGGAFY